MDEQQIRQALAEIAAREVPAGTDLWPAVESRLQQRWPWAMGRQLLLHLAGAGLTLAAMALFMAWISSLMQVTIQAPAIDAIPFSQQVIPADTLLYPEAPVTLPRYRVEMVPAPDTVEKALAWAVDFGLPNPKLFRDPRSPELLMAVGSDGRRLIFSEPNRLIFPSSAASRWGIGYLRADFDQLPEGETLSMAAGVAVAESFLEEHGLLPARYQVRDLLSPMSGSDGYPPRLIQVSPDLDGYAFYGSSGWHGPLATLVIDAQGQVFSAGFSQADFTAADQVPIRPARAAVDDFVGGRSTPIHIDILPAWPGFPGITRYDPPLPGHTIGDYVNILETDDTHFLVAEDGSEIRATLRTSAGARYELITPDLSQIVDMIEYDELRVEGTIVAQTAPDTWRLEVNTWEILPQQVFVSGCAIGPVEIDGSGKAWIVAEEFIGQLEQNDRYHVPDLPAAIHSGDRIEVCTEPMLELGEALTWMAIYAPPRNLDIGAATDTDLLVIEQVELAYYFDPAGDHNLAEPVWVVTGRSRDNTHRFVAYLEATDAEPGPLPTALPSPAGLNLSLSFRRPLHGQPPFTATFTASANDGLDQELAACRQVSWDFGDGSVSQPCPASGAGHLLTASHTYEQPGTYHTRVQMVLDDGRAIDSDKTQTVIVAEPQPPSSWAGIIWWSLWLAILVALAVALVWLRWRGRRARFTGYAFIGFLLITYVPPFSYLPDPLGFIWGGSGGYRYDPRLPFANRFVIAGDPTDSLRPYLDGLIGQTGLDPLDPAAPLAGYDFIQVRQHRYHIEVLTRFTYADDSQRTYPIPLYQPLSLFGFFQSGWWYDGLARLRTEHRELAGTPFASDTAPLQLGTPQRLALSGPSQALDQENPANWYHYSIPGMEQQLLWSLHGDAFLMRTIDHGQTALWLVTLDGRQPVPIATNVIEYAWLPDGDHILYSVVGTIQPGDKPFHPVFLVSRDGRRPQEVVRLSLGALPGVTEEGLWYAADGALWLAPATGGEPQSLAFLPGVVESVDGFWQRVLVRPTPQGDRVAYTCGHALCLQNRNGTEWVQVLPDTRQVSLAWSHDGTRLAVVYWDYHNPATLTILTREGAIEHEVTIAPNGFVAAPQWTPAGDRLFIQAHPFNGRRILTVDVATGQVLDLSRPRWDAWFALAPDGNNLLLSNGRGGFWLTEVYDPKPDNHSTTP